MNCTESSRRLLGSARMIQRPIWDRQWPRALHHLQWLWRCQWCQHWLRPAQWQWLTLQQRSQPWRWLQFWQQQSHGGLVLAPWGQQFHHQIHHHLLLLQQEDLKALKSSYWYLVPHCLRSPIQLHCPFLRMLPLSCFQLLLAYELELKFQSYYFLCLYQLHLSFPYSPSEG